jgi:ABC-type Mn2+/Zn2+ transport system ATPase subunit
MIHFENLDLGYGKKIILKNVNGRIKKGGFVGIVGANGSGKTTLLRTILGWVKPLSGKINSKSELHYGYVPQRNVIDPLYPLTALDVVLMGLYGKSSVFKKMGDDERQNALQTLGQVGLLEKADFLFHELSGGQQQRTLLARALISQPDILILDEPTNGMDIVSEASVMDTIQKIHEKTGMTIIIVTHLLHVVAHYATELGLIKGNQIEFGSTQELLTSEHLTELYGTPIMVSQVQGKTVVIAI